MFVLKGLYNLSVNRKLDSELARLSTYGAQETVNRKLFPFYYDVDYLLNVRAVDGAVFVHVALLGSKSRRLPLSPS